MSAYQLTWITDDLAVGYAPMSYTDLDLIRADGIDAIVNLCAEFCDLHEIEENSGFEVFYLPIPDECAPDMEEMEKALAWLDEALYLGKKILVHCRHGIGRTGTFVTSYLIRKGLGLKVAEKKLKGTRANPTNYSQWRLLKKYSKKSGMLKIREPSLESKNVVDLSTYFIEYEALVRKIDEDIETVKNSYREASACGVDTDDCCYRYFDLELIEAIYLSNRINRALTSNSRREVIHNAVEVGKKIRMIKKVPVKSGDDLENNKASVAEAYGSGKILCPLNREHRCSLFDYRPISCRVYNLPSNAVDLLLTESMLQNFSRNVFFALSGVFPEDENLVFCLADTVSGKFVQEYFYYLAKFEK